MNELIPLQEIKPTLDGLLQYLLARPTKNLGPSDPDNGHISDYMRSIFHLEDADLWGEDVFGVRMTRLGKHPTTPPTYYEDEWRITLPLQLQLFQAHARRHTDFTVQRAIDLIGRLKKIPAE